MYLRWLVCLHLYLLLHLVERVENEQGLGELKCKNSRQSDDGAHNHESDHVHQQVAAISPCRVTPHPGEYGSAKSVSGQLFAIYYVYTYCYSIFFC